MSTVRWILFTVFYSLFCLFAQSAILGAFLPLSFVPHLALLLVIFMSFYEISSLGAVLAFLIGLLIDIAAGGTVGPSAAASVFIYGVLITISDRIFIESVVASFIVTLFAVLVYHLVYLALASTVEPSFSSLVTIALGQGVVTGLFAPWVFSILSGSIVSNSKRHERM